MHGGPRRWNHYIHYHPIILQAAPDGCTRALDVGCGEGILARELCAVSGSVIGIDTDGPSIERARAQGGGVDYVLDDFLTHDFPPESFDLVASVAALHHMDAASALDRMAALLRPGGRLAVLGLARSRLPAELPIEVAAFAVNRLHMRTRTYWGHSAPTVWPPPETYRGIRTIAEDRLPGVCYRRHLLWRYSLVWTKPH